MIFDNILNFIVIGYELVFVMKVVIFLVFWKMELNK